VETQRSSTAGNDFLPAKHTPASAEHQPRSMGVKLTTPRRKQSPPCALKRIRRSAGNCAKGAVWHRGQGTSHNQERIKGARGI